MSLILAPCRARGSATTARRSLVTLPVSSHHARRAVLVFARAKMCGHLSLVRSTKCPPWKPQASFPQFTKESVGHLMGGHSPFSSTILSKGRHNLVHDDLRPCGDPDSLRSKEALVSRSLVNVSSPMIFCNLGKQ